MSISKVVLAFFLTMFLLCCQVATSGESGMENYQQLKVALKAYLSSTPEEDIASLAEGMTDAEVEIEDGIVRIGEWVFKKADMTLTRYLPPYAMAGYDYVAHVKSGEGGWKIIKIERVEVIR